MDNLTLLILIAIIFGLSYTSITLYIELKNVRENNLKNLNNISQLNTENIRLENQTLTLTDIVKTKDKMLKHVMDKNIDLNNKLKVMDIDNPN